MFISRKKLAALEAAHAELHKTMNEVVENAAKLRDNAFLIGIEKSGRVLKFTFVRNGEFTVIETYATMGDDVEGWKNRLLG